MPSSARASATETATGPRTVVAMVVRQRPAVRRAHRRRSAAGRPGHECHRYGRKRVRLDRHLPQVPAPVHPAGRSSPGPRPPSRRSPATAGRSSSSTRSLNAILSVNTRLARHAPTARPRTTPSAAPPGGRPPSSRSWSTAPGRPSCRPPPGCRTPPRPRASPSRPPASPAPPSAATGPGAGSPGWPTSPGPRPPPRRPPATADRSSN